MVRIGSRASGVTETMIVREEVRPRKLVRLRVKVYVASGRLLLAMLTGRYTW
jgi:hypothetical protein